MDDEKQGHSCYWFQDTTNPYAVRIKQAIEDAYNHPVPPFRIAEFLRAVADEINPPPKDPYFLRVVTAFKGLWLAIINQ